MIASRKVSADRFAIYQVVEDDNIAWAFYVDRKELSELKNAVDRVMMNLGGDGERAQGSGDSPASTPGPDTR